jgi:serine/threonine-protein kinase
MPSIETIKVDHLIGTEVGTSTLVKELARGGMAIVFIAFQRTLKRQIAVKILPKSFLTPSSARLFQQEAESAAILSHQNIIQIYEVGETEEFLFFTMQLIQGSPLSKIMHMAKKNVIPSKRTLPLQTTIQIYIQVLDALDYAHNQEIVHRDMKPGNVMIENHNQRPIITDFGVARLLRGEESGKPMIQGTPLYMAPEQILGQKLDGRADIYALGTMLFEMLVTQLPIPQYKSKVDMLKAKVLNENGMFQKKPSELRADLNEDMDLILQKALAKDPNQRYETCQDFIKDLEQYRNNYLT